MGNLVAWWFGEGGGGTTKRPGDQITSQRRQYRDLPPRLQQCNAIAAIRLVRLPLRIAQGEWLPAGEGSGRSNCRQRLLAAKSASPVASGCFRREALPKRLDRQFVEFGAVVAQKPLPQRLVPDLHVVVDP